MAHKDMTCKKNFKILQKNPAILIISINSYWATIDTSQKLDKIFLKYEIQLL